MMGTVFDKNIREVIYGFLLDSTEVENYLDLVGIMQSVIHRQYLEGQFLRTW